MKLLNYTNEVLNTKHVSTGEQHYIATSSDVTSDDNRAIIVKCYPGVLLDLEAFRNSSPCMMYSIKISFNLQNSLNSDRSCKHCFCDERASFPPGLVLLCGAI